MGKIKMPPEPIRYPFPKALGEGYSTGTVLGRVMEIEQIPNWGDYKRIIDWIRFDEAHTRDSVIPIHYELRFTQYYRKSGGTDNDWVYGQGAGHMSIATFYKLIEKAQTNPDYRTFEGAFDRLKIKG
jgi:hypothetical protein